MRKQLHADVADTRTHKHAFKGIDSEVHSLNGYNPNEQEWAQVHAVSTLDLTKLGVGEVRLLLNGLSLAARSQHDGHRYAELYSQLARRYYAHLDATNAVIDSFNSPG